LTRVFSIASVCLFLCAGLARAGEAPAVASPFANDVCADPLDVIDNLVDPVAYYRNAPKCEALCRKAEADCKQYVRSAFACQMASIGDDSSYDKKECELEFEDGADKRECKSTVDGKAGSSKNEVREKRDAALGDCEDWGTVCENTCHGTI